MNTFGDFYYWFVVLPVVIDLYAIVTSVLSVMWIIIWLVRLIFWGLD